MKMNALRNCLTTTATLVCVLFAHCRPAAVAGFVVAVVVWVSINAVAPGWSMAHISQESFKGIQPSFTDGNATATIVGKMRVRFPGTPLDHAVPGVVRQPLGVAVNYPSRGGQFILNTPAASGCSSQQVVRVNKCKSTIATAFAFPYRTVMTVLSSKLDNSELPECSTGKIDASPENFVTINFSHDEVLHERTELWLEPADVCASVRLASFYKK